jgi:acetate kinase
MHILTINAGSSSVKFTLYTKEGLQMAADGMVERIGLSETRVVYQNAAGDHITREARVTDTQEAVSLITSLLVDQDIGVINSKEEISAVGHRVVHGGEKISRSVIIDKNVKKIIQDCFELAPLHNPPNLEGIVACEGLFPGVPQVAVFDTAFHASLPEYAYLYGLPYRFYRENKIRRYGFHGTSHKFVAHEAAELLGRPIETLKIVTCHLGNGSGITAVDRGRSVDTSMGLTPLEGCVMGTRCGDIDAAIIFYLMKNKKLGMDQTYELLNKQSGLLGLADIGSSDFRDLLNAMQKGNAQAETAIKVFAYRIKKYIGSYTFAMGGLDAIVFTAGIGENSSLVRQLVCNGLEGLGIALDDEKNLAGNRKRSEIQSDRSKVKIMVVPTNEEKEIAFQTIQTLSENI